MPEVHRAMGCRGRSSLSWVSSGHRSLTWGQSILAEHSPRSTAHGPEVFPICAAWRPLARLLDGEVEPDVRPVADDLAVLEVRAGVKVVELVDPFNGLGGHLKRPGGGVAQGPVGTAFQVGLVHDRHAAP